VRRSGDYRVLSTGDGAHQQRLLDRIPRLVVLAVQHQNGDVDAAQERPERRGGEQGAHLADHRGGVERQEAVAFEGLALGVLVDRVRRRGAERLLRDGQGSSQPGIARGDGDTDLVVGTLLALGTQPGVGQDQRAQPLAGDRRGALRDQPAQRVPEQMTLPQPQRVGRPQDPPAAISSP